jgi:hypothetical protein
MMNLVSNTKEEIKSPRNLESNGKGYDQAKLKVVLSLYRSGEVFSLRI